VKLLYVVGTRPNFVKVAPVLHELRRRLSRAEHVLVHTGQHYDRELSDLFLEELQMPEPDHYLDVGSGAHGAQTGRALERIESVLLQERPDIVIVAGDVNSTLAAALAAAKLELPLAHVEAGLRSFDRSMPEEINRVLTDQISRWCFTHSPEARDNLLREGVPAEKIHEVGNTMIDSLVRLEPRIAAADVHARLGIESGGYALVTLHRPPLVDGPLLPRALTSLARLSRRLPVIFPMHPRARARALDLPSAPDLRLIQPVGYIDFLALERGATAVITDSGGVQEETTYLRVPCFTLRETTERPVTLREGTNRLLGLDVELVEQVPELVASTQRPLAPPAGWDGRAAERLATVLVGALDTELDVCVESAAL
jgi:UDP-N-acetylglucosamine 2-epimerase (non-hydrolysing)